MDRKYVIMFVDDEESILNAMTRIFAFEKQYELVLTTHAREALEIIEKRSIDLVISDQRMPEMLGTTLLKEIKKRRPEIMRILLSGYSDFDAMIRAINEGEVFRFITKPWDNKELLNIIHDALTQKEAFEAVNALAKQVTNAIADNASLNVVTAQDEKSVYLRLESEKPIAVEGVFANIFQLLNRIKEKKGHLSQGSSCLAGSMEKKQSKLIFTVYVGQGFSLVIEMPTGDVN